MKMPSSRRVLLLGLMLMGSVGVSEAARETVSVTENRIAFTGVRYNDGRSKPYRIKFSLDDTRSLYMFNSDTQVTDIKVGTERYKVLYDTSDNLERVEQTSSTRRGLAQREQNAAAITSRRLEFADCNVCADAWDALCAGGRSVCDLVDYGPPFSTTAAASVEAVCENFCKDLTAGREGLAKINARKRSASTRASTLPVTTTSARFRETQLWNSPNATSRMTTSPFCRHASRPSGKPTSRDFISTIASA